MRIRRGCRPEIALDEMGYVLTGSDVRPRGMGPDRDPYCWRRASGHLRLGRAARPAETCRCAVGEGSMAIAFVHQYAKDAQLTPSP